MARPRGHGKKTLPQNLYVQKRPKGDYFSYRNPITKTQLAIGFDREEAIAFAERSNLELEAELLDRKSRGLRSHDEIVMGSIEYSGKPGIYFLMQNFEIVYIGMSQDVFARIGQHKDRGEIPFNRIFAIPCEPQDLTRMEALYIRRHKPRFNVKIPVTALVRR